MEPIALSENEQKLQALKINEQRLKDKIKQFGDAPEHAQNVARAQAHLSELQTEIKKLSPPPASKSTKNK